MTQAEVEAALSAEGIDPVDVTEPTEPHWSWMAIYGRGADQVSVMYEAETDTVDQLILYLEGDVTSNWNTRGGISLGSSQETIEKTYADTGSTANGTFLAYYYDANGNPSDASQVSQGDVLVALDLNDSPMHFTDPPRKPDAPRESLIPPRSTETVPSHSKVYRQVIL